MDVVAVLCILFLLAGIHLLGSIGEPGECSGCGEHGQVYSYWSDDGIIYYFCEKPECVLKAQNSGCKR